MLIILFTKLQLGAKPVVEIIKGISYTSRIEARWGINASAIVISSSGMENQDLNSLRSSDIYMFRQYMPSSVQIMTSVKPLS